MFSVLHIEKLNTKKYKENIRFCQLILSVFVSRITISVFRITVSWNDRLLATVILFYIEYSTEFNRKLTFADMHLCQEDLFWMINKKITNTKDFGM